MAVPLTAGTRLGPYEVIASLGAGGMGEVHLARDTRLDRKVAIKVLLPGRVGHGASHERFQSEARAVSSLNHPHICTLHDVGEQDGRDYLVMELVEGDTVAHRLGRGPLPADQILRHAVEIAEALDHAHRHGIVHRDLKPANVMLTKAGAKLLDFGLAKWHATNAPGVLESLATATRELPLTDQGHVVGTLQYMAPEQLEGRAVDARTDLFAFGALVHEMATGRKAFEATSQTALITAILSAEPPSISALQPLSPPALDRIVKKCLAKDPDQRWQTARDLADALRWIGQDSADVSSSRAVPTAPVSRTRPVRRWVLGAALIAVTAVMVAGFWVWRRSADSLHATGLRLVSTFSGEHWGPSFSPDGNLIAFLRDVEGVTQVWVKNLVEGDPIQVTFGEIPARRVAWSPLNDRIVFSRFRGGLWSVPPLGGQPRRILEFGDAPKFSGDGKRLVFTRGNAIWIANADGGDAHEVAGVPGTPWNIDRSPDLSPDGKMIAFFHTGDSPIWGDIWIIPSEGGQARQLTFDSGEGGWPSWAPDGRFIVYSSTRAGSLTLWRVPATGGTPAPLTTGAGEDTEADISADGDRLLYSTQRKSSSLVLLDPATGQEKELLSLRTPIFMGAFSPSGNRIAFVRPTGNSAHLHIISADGRDVRQVTRGEGEQNILPQWSSDEASLYFYRHRPLKSFRKIPVEGGTSSEVAPLDLLRETSARVDAQGRAVVYTIEDNRRPMSTVVRDLGSGKERTLGRTINNPRWSPDSRTVFGWYTAPDPKGDIWNVAGCTVDGQPCVTIAKGFSPIPSADGSRLFYIRDTGAARSTRELWTASVDGTNSRKVGTLGPLPRDWSYDVSRTDQIVFNRSNASRRELWVAQLRK